ncbi:alpha/beta fold hydrolase [Effusibacillus dendaii]|uniref:alpha/beta fold hydrolase n=1 Tax=Effusibacillus dendaii TaxID=2743772 RepID=UPI0019091DB3|nr:alpha/beta fold hydrolase [Effusibacillus dendaii]
MIEERFLWDVGKQCRPDPGTELFYRSCIPLRPRLILIMVHGAGQHSGQFFDSGMYCLQHGIAFYALDLRGFGKSSGKRGYVRSFLEYLNDLDQFIEHIRRNHPADPVFFAGAQSWGDNRYTLWPRTPTLYTGSDFVSTGFKVAFTYSKFTQSCSSFPVLGNTFDLYKWSPIVATIPRFKSIFNGNLSPKPDPLSTHEYSVCWYTELIVNGHQKIKNIFRFLV